MKKEDIREHKLIKVAMEEEKLQLLNWMVEWDAKGSLEGFYDTIYHPPVDYRHSRSYHPVMHYYASKKYDLFIEVLGITLHHYSQQLGLLFLEDSKNNNATVISMAYKNVGISTAAWEDIEDVLSEVDSSLTLLAYNEETNMFTFMVAAAGVSADLNVLYYLMRRKSYEINIERNTKRKYFHAPHLCFMFPYIL